MRLMDALLLIGRSRELAPFQRSDLDSIRRMLDKYGIERALLAPFSWGASSVERANEMVFEAASGDERLTPCPIAIPESGLGMGDEEEFVTEAIRAGARCVCLYPQWLRTTLDPRVIGPMLSALEERGLPLALFETTVQEAAQAAEKYPDLPVIVHAPDTRNRHWLPAFQQVPNLYISTAANFSPYLGLEVLSERADPERILFATRYPVAETGAAISYLLHSSLPDETVEKIAFRNLERLMVNVRLEEDDVEGWREDIVLMTEADDPAGRVGGVCDCVWRREPLP